MRWLALRPRRFNRSAARANVASGGAADADAPLGSGMIFSAPERLICLLPLVALVLLLAWKRRKPSIVHPFLLQLAKRLRPAPRWIYLPRVLEVLALAVLIPALLSPVLPLAR